MCMYICKLCNYRNDEQICLVVRGTAIFECWGGGVEMERKRRAQFENLPNPQNIRFSYCSVGTFLIIVAVRSTSLSLM